MLAVDALQADNNLLKEELSDILKKNLSHETLDNLESFHAQLLNKDVALALLRHDIATQCRRSPDMTRGTSTTWTLQLQQQKLHTDIITMSHEIVVLKDRLERIRTSRTED